MNENQPSFFSIIPANVRYDKGLTANAKLLYSEITALTNKEGYCWASDQYFADLYESSKRTIQNWLSTLEKNGYIRREVIYKSGTKEIEKRLIYLQQNISNVVPSENNFTTPMENNFTTPTENNFRDNSTSINNTNTNKTYNTDTKDKDTIKPSTFDQSNLSETTKSHSTATAINRDFEIKNSDLHNDLFSELTYSRIEMLAKDLNLSAKEISDLILSAKNKALTKQGYPGSTIDIKLYKNKVERVLARILMQYKAQSVNNPKGYIYNAVLQEFTNLFSRLYIANQLLGNEKIRDIGEAGLNQYSSEIDLWIQQSVNGLISSTGQVDVAE